MKQAVFKPTWDAFTLSPVVETHGVNVLVPFALRATVMLDPGENTFQLDFSDIPNITSLKKNGVVDVSYTTDEDGVVTLASASDELSIIEIERSGDIHYSIFVGTIVPGIIISPTGRLKGIVGNIPSKEAHVYRFGLRARWGVHVADVIKDWTASPTANQLSWNSDTLPEPELDSTKVAGKPFYTFGEFRRGQMVEIGIDVYNPDFTDFEVKSRPSTAMVVAAKHFSTLPLGLSIANNPLVIGGFIPAEAISGDYFVELYVEGPLTPAPIVAHFNIVGTEFDKFTAVNRISWVTDTSLGTIREGHAATFKVEAINGNGSPVTYKLAPGSRPLPVGMTLDLTTGEIKGIAPHYDVDTRVDFSVKATSGVYVSTKAFSFKLLNTFLTSRHLTISLPLAGPIRRSWQSYAEQISPNRRFRPNDNNFGSAVPNMLLIRGLRSLPLTALDYDEPIKLIAGAFKVAAFVQDKVHICDVIYREFFDPMYRAGGFVTDDIDIAESPVFYPQNPTIQIKESTIRNLRADLTTKIGLNSTKQKTLGPTGGELLDPWMLSPQANGKSLGYLTAGIIDYVQADEGAAIVRNLDYGDIPIGTNILFDRLLVQEGASSYYFYLGWDGNQTEVVDSNTPLSVVDLRVDGISVTDDVGMHTLPNVTWVASQAGTSFTLRFYNGRDLLRTVSELESPYFTYTTAMQYEDANPGHLFIEVTAVRDGAESPPSVASVRMRAGWGYAWGFRYGGE